MSDPTEQDKLTQRSRELFDEQVVNQDARTRSRLNQARQAALDVARQQQRTHNHGFGSRWLLPVGSAAALALVAVTTVQIMRPSPDHAEIASSEALASVDDVEILTSEAEPEMLQNMEFYAWLETQQTDAPDADKNEAG